MLSPLQKMAWFNLAVFAGAVLLYLLAVPALAWSFGRSVATAAVPALGVFGLCGLWGFGGKFLRDRQTRRKINLDECDLMIYRQAIIAGWSAFWVIFVAVCMVLWGVVRYVKGNSNVPVDLLPGFVFLGGIVATVTQSIVILVQYGRSAGDE